MRERESVCVFVRVCVCERESVVVLTNDTQHLIYSLDFTSSFLSV